MKYFVVILVISISLQAFAQQDPQYTQYMYNMAMLNPAYAGSADNISLGLLYRNQWTGFSDAPQTGTFFGHSPVGNALGLGLSVISDKLGPVTETNIYADVSYTLKLSNDHRLAFGIKAGATFHNIGLAGLDLIDEGDPFFQNVNSVTPNLGAGFFYYSDVYYVSLSVPNLMSSVHLDANNNQIGSETQHFFLTAGYVFNISETIKLKPSFLIKSAFNAATSFDLNANALFFEKFEIGTSYRLDDSFSGLVNFLITPNLRIGYAYDAVTSGIYNYAPASHEVFLLFNINLPRKTLVSPRFF